MGAYLEAWLTGGVQRFQLDGPRLSIGKAPGNDVAVRSDASMSRVHLVLEAVGPGWAATDVGSRNGTFINGQRLNGSHLLRPGDEIVAGSTRFTFTVIGADGEVSETTMGQAPPRLTERETDVLDALCRPVLEGSMLSEPASVSEIADVLVVTDSAVKKHLANLYDKFDLVGRGRRRGSLVAEALARGAVSRGRFGS
jgi:DNA-binding CsgD family transcriptional regulator